MDRRAFLKSSAKVVAGLGGAPLLPRIFASSASAQNSSNYKAIVCLMLAGGNDGNNMLIPADKYYSQYAVGRGPLALDRASLNVISPTSSGRLFGLHPSLKNIAALYNNGHAACLANVGPLTAPTTKQSFQSGAALPQDLYSHSSQSNEWESANTLTVSATGWAGRMADTLLMRGAKSSVAPLVISTAGWSLLGAGVNTSAASIGTGANNVSVLNAMQVLLPSVSQMEQGDTKNHLHDALSSMQSGIIKTTSALSSAYQAGSTIKTSFPNSSIGQQLQTIAYLINARNALQNSTQVFFCMDGGYDTHGNQLPTHAAKLGGIDTAIGSFVHAMQEIGMFEQVTLFTMSDFARSHQANSSNGTDHAWGNHHLVVGGAVRGGDVYGTFPSLALGGDDDSNTTGLWIPTTSGSQYAATLTKWLGVNSADNLSIFPELTNFPESSLAML